MKAKAELYIGLMSGTSVDGIDAALVEITSANQLKVIETQFTPFEDQLRQQINRLAQASSGLDKCSDSSLHQSLASLYARACVSLLEKARVEGSNIAAIANHGQTIRHEPNAPKPFSLQLGDPQLIANITNIPTIGNFRQADIEAGGQGAPLMPAFHQAVFSNNTQSHILNIGGIANITKLGSTVIGFDTGPGNTLMDQWIEQHLRRKYDHNGKWAHSGKVIRPLLENLLNDDYFKQPFPKSTGPDYFNLTWLSNRYESLSKHASKDVQATLLALTATTIATEIKNTSTAAGKVFVCGGGTHNTALINALGLALPGFTIETTDSFGIPSDWVESAGFAWLGYCCKHNLPSNLPSVTGARREVVLGEIYEPKATA